MKSGEVKIGQYVNVEPRYVTLTPVGGAGRIVACLDDSSNVAVRLDSGRLVWVEPTDVTLDTRYAQP